MKQLIRNILIALRIPVTKNIHYDILTKKLMAKVLKSQSNCIDIGGFKGEIMSEILKFSPRGRHFIFEPIPDLFKNIEAKFKNLGNVTVLNLAVSDKKGTSTFKFVPDYPAYSGLKQRDYPDNNTEVKEIEVKTDRLENVIPDNIKIDFIKIDVEGAEFLVLSGAVKILHQSKPVVIFEYGLGASDFYGTEPDMMFNFFEASGYGIFLLEDYMKNKPHLQKDSFGKQYHEKLNYYFAAAPV
ncbi:MAG: FkbM family methyltransferase [Bacteroidales bacterium]|nr:FkbM family methyltransferase [Bacteroidales bacterium]